MHFRLRFIVEGEGIVVQVVPDAGPQGFAFAPLFSFSFSLAELRGLQ